MNREFLVLEEKDGYILILHKSSGNLYAYPNGFVQNVVETFYNSKWFLIRPDRKMIRNAVDHFRFHGGNFLRLNIAKLPPEILKFIDELPKQ